MVMVVRQLFSCRSCSRSWSWAGGRERGCGRGSPGGGRRLQGKQRPYLRRSPARSPPSGTSPPRPAAGSGSWRRGGRAAPRGGGPPVGPHLLEDAAHHLHRGVVRRDLHVHLQRLLQDLAHDLRPDQRVVLGQVAVQLLHLVLQALDLRLQHLRGAGGRARGSSDRQRGRGQPRAPRPVPSPLPTR